MEYPVYYFAAAESALANMIAVDNSNGTYDEQWLNEMFYWAGRAPFSDLSSKQIDEYASIKAYIRQHSLWSKDDLKREYAAIQDEYNNVILKVDYVFPPMMTLLDYWYFSDKLKNPCVLDYGGEEYGR